MVSAIRKWGNSLGLRIPKSLAEYFHIREGIRVELLPREDGILIKFLENEMTMEQILKSIPNDYVPDQEILPDTLPSEEW